ncbi:MAG: peptidoglycan-associated lipoprotein Pal [Proteobacteria bacterium]|nr:peptidoglycan-associated lipoprotein Pal [Pseudomonadota bacterium]
MVERTLIRHAAIAALLAIVLGVAGCASHKPKPSAGAGGAGAASSTEAAGAQGAGVGAAASASGNPDDETAGPQAGLLATRIVYFEFDSTEIKGAGTEVVGAHARYLAANPTARVRLEGNTDERGSREYNIGLGERRAQAVRHALLLQGAADGQISTVSYGEERPAAPGHDEEAWAKNRRVEIVYLTPAAPAKQ